MDFFNVVSVEEARNEMEIVFKDFKLELEEIPLLESHNRVLAEDVVSDINVPEFNRSTVDGYAIKSRDSHGASSSIPGVLSIIGEVKMGKISTHSINSGEAIYVPTGGMIPAGADAVIMIEDTEKLDGITLMVYKPVSHNENIVLNGQDIAIGEVALNKGRVLTPEAIGVLAALGKSQVKVYKKPRFYIISTGDEIIDLDEKLEIGKVRDINSYALDGLVKNLGGDVVYRTIVKDNYEKLRTEVEKAINESDVILISGGSSVGTRDYTDKVINSFHGKGVFIHGISIKPGKPTIIGEIEGKPIIGLPGHPVSSIVVFKVIIEEFINKKLGKENIISQTKAIMNFNFPSSSGRETYQMVKLNEINGKVYGNPSFGESGMISLLANADGYIIIKSHEEGVYKGEERQVYLLK